MSSTLNDEQNKSKSISMDLENLQQNYSNLLIKYQQAVSDYMNYLNNVDISSNNPFVFIKGQAFNGTGTAGESTASTLQNCMASCANLKGCTGATFVSNQCELRTGDSPVVPSTQNSYAIIPKSKQLLLNMENINQQLINTNQKIINVTKAANPVYNSQTIERGLQQEDLLNNYQQLEEERKKISELLQEYEELDNEAIENNINIDKYQYTYVLLFILVVGIIYVLFKLSYPSEASVISEPNIQYGGDLGNNTYIIILGIFVVIILIKYFYNFS